MENSLLYHYVLNKTDENMLFKNPNTISGLAVAF